MELADEFGEIPALTVTRPTLEEIYLNMIGEASTTGEIDWCGYPVQANTNSPLDLLQKPYILMRGVLDTLDRDIVYSLCQYGWGKVWEWGDQVGGNLWRVTGDINDNWWSMSSIGFQQTGHEKYAGPGHWNDTDMLVVGHLGWGRINPPRPTSLTPNEQLTHISLWALQAAPLLIGADMTQMDGGPSTCSATAKCSPSTRTRWARPRGASGPTTGRRCGRVRCRTARWRWDFSTARPRRCR